MDKPFLLGLQSSLRNSPYLSTPEAYARVGQNTGNLAFHHAINGQLGGGLPSVEWHADLRDIHDAGSLAVLPCANQLGPHQDFSTLAAKFGALDTRLVAIGLGAQGGIDGAIPEVPAGTLDWVRAIAEHAPTAQPNIAVRGPFTLEVLAHYGLADQAVALGCPSLFINPDPRLGQAIATRCGRFKRIAVAAGHQGWKHLARIEASLAQLVTATGGSYIGQSPLEMVHLTRGEAMLLTPAQRTACREYACPQMDDEEFSRWSSVHGNVFFDVPGWMEHYRHFDFVIGTRIHGVMLALQAGVPAMCIAHDSRTLELCQFMRIPHVLARDVAQGIRRDALPALFHFDGDAFDRNRAHLCGRYLEFLRSNQLPAADWLGMIAAAATAPMATESEGQAHG